MLLVRRGPDVSSAEWCSVRAVWLVFYLALNRAIYQQSKVRLQPASFFVYELIMKGGTEKNMLHFWFLLYKARREILDAQKQTERHNLNAGSTLWCSCSPSNSPSA